MEDTENSQHVHGYPECKNIKPYVEKIDVPCPVCGAEVYVRKTKRGKNFYICSRNTNTGKKNENDEQAENVELKTDSCNYISWNKPKVGEKWTPEIEKEINKEKSKKRRARSTKKKATTKKSSSKKTTTNEASNKKQRQTKP